MARMKRVQTTKNEPTVTFETVVEGYKERRAFADANGLEDWQVTSCRICNVLLAMKDLRQHRLDTHDTPRGITRHTKHYNDGQTIIIDPYTLTANLKKPTGSFSSYDWSEQHIEIRAEDQDIDMPARYVNIMLSKANAIKLAHQLLELAK